MTITKFEDILSWQKSKELALNIYSEFSDNRDFSFRDQIRRASVSIMNNIAEGFERQSNKQFVYFLYVAKGSCGEVRSMLYLSKDFKYISDETFNRLFKLCIEISNLIAGFIKSLNVKK